MPNYPAGADCSTLAHNQAALALAPLAFSGPHRVSEGLRWAARELAAALAGRTDDEAVCLRGAAIIVELEADVVHEMEGILYSRTDRERGQRFRAWLRRRFGRA